MPEIISFIEKANGEIISRGEQITLEEFQSLEKPLQNQKNHCLMNLILMII
jgi:hypothetical protein